MQRKESKQNSELQDVSLHLTQAHAITICIICVIEVGAVVMHLRLWATAVKFRAYVLNVRGD